MSKTKFWRQIVVYKMTFVTRLLGMYFDILEDRQTAHDPLPLDLTVLSNWRRSSEAKNPPFWTYHLLSCRYRELCKVKNTAKTTKEVQNSKTDQNRRECDYYCAFATFSVVLCQGLRDSPYPWTSIFQDQSTTNSQRAADVSEQNKTVTSSLVPALLQILWQYSVDTDFFDTEDWC